MNRAELEASLRCKREPGGHEVSNLNPGGSRSPGPRAFTAQQIAKACEQNKIPDVDKPSHSPAGKDHQHSREVQRLRQQKRNGHAG